MPILDFKPPIALQVVSLASLLGISVLSCRFRTLAPRTDTGDPGGVVLALTAPDGLTLSSGQLFDLGWANGKGVRERST